MDVGGKDFQGQIAEAKYLITDPGEIEANARLIAAAPDLLEAAKGLIWKLSHNGDPDYNPGPVKIDRKDATIIILEEAIAKAEGRE